MSRWAGAAGVLVVLALSMAFASLNGGQKVTLRLGLVTLYGIPLTAVAFGALIVGMLVMVITSIHSDLRIRRILRERLAVEDREEKARSLVDSHQRDLFEQESG